MENYLRLSLLVVAVVIVFVIAFESWLRRRRLRLAELSALNFTADFVPETAAVTENNDCDFHLPPPEEISKSEAPTPEPTAAPQTILTLSVFAKAHGRFASYELLQAITAAGLQFGEMNIFHYYLTTDKGRVTLFSLASATRPGTFDLDQIGSFSCVGLTMFVDLETVPDPKSAFAKMLLTAEQLADDLDGELFAKPGVRWDQEILQQYREILAQW